MAIVCQTISPPEEWNGGRMADFRMGVETWLTALPIQCRGAISRRQMGGAPLDGDAVALADASRWAIWSAMSDDDRDDWTRQLLAWSREAERWGNAG